MRNVILSTLISLILGPSCSEGPNTTEPSENIAALDPARAGSGDRVGAPGITLANGGTWTNSRRPTLELSWPSGTTEVCLSTSSSCSVWQAAAEGLSLLIADNPLPQTIYASFRDSKGLLLGSAQTTVRYDPKAPEKGTLSGSALPGAVSLTWSGFSDALSGVGAYRVVGAAGGAAPYCSRTAMTLWEGTATNATISGLRAEAHSFRVCAIDRAGNLSLGATVSLSPSGESESPVVGGFAIAGGAAAVSSRDTQISASVSDASGVIEVCTSESATTSDSCLVWNDWTGTKDIELSGGEGLKEVRAWFRDIHGNVSVTSSDTVLFDRTGPTGGEVVASASAAGLGLTWSGFEDVGSGISSYFVQVAADRAPADCASGTRAWSGSASSTTITGLSEGRWGARVCAVDAAGNTGGGETANATLLAEYSPPTISSLQLGGGATSIFGRDVSWTISASDSSGIDRMCISSTPTCSRWIAYAESGNFEFPAGTSGSVSLYVWLEDGLGNQSVSPSTASIILVPIVDADGDGVDNRTDCNEGNANVYPGAVEICGGIDEDCDGLVDDADPGLNPATGTLHYLDLDHDGHGVPTSTHYYCSTPVGWATLADDCDDGDSEISPTALERCGDVDYDCDGIVAESCTSCKEILDEGLSSGDGLYEIDPDGSGPMADTEVWCEMDAAGGGWTLIQRTVWDWTESQSLLTTYPVFFNQTIGDPEPGTAFRIAGESWDDLMANGGMMMVHEARDLLSGASCAPLTYVASSGRITANSSALTLSGLSMPVTMYNQSAFSAVGSGPSTCPASQQAVPWFYTWCCTTCPTYRGGYWTDAPHPMASYLDSSRDYYGRTTANTCPSGAAISSYNYEGINSMEVYLR